MHVREKKIPVTQMFGMCHVSGAIMIFDNMDEKEQNRDFE